MPIIDSDYKAPRWAKGSHLQTILAAKLCPRPKVDYRRERWETPDDDFIDVDWTRDENLDPTTPIVVHFHGLEGCSKAHYAVALMNEVVSRCWRGCIPHFRGCSEEMNRQKCSYHAGKTDEVLWILEKIKERFPRAPIYAVGISFGGNLLALFLGQQGEKAKKLITAAASLGAPLDLLSCANYLSQGFNKVYSLFFLWTMIPKALAKLRQHPELQAFINSKLIRRCRSLYDFDSLFTAPLHGFRNVLEYSQQTSAKSLLKNIQVPTLLLNAKNDSFFPAPALPTLKDVSDCVWLEQPDQGGHVGFPTGRFPGRIDYMPKRVMKFFDDLQNSHQS